MLTQEEIERLDKLLNQLKEWTEKLYELLTNRQKERIVGCNCDEIACICNKRRIDELDKREG